MSLYTRSIKAAVRAQREYFNASEHHSLHYCLILFSTGLQDQVIKSLQWKTR